jgi:hypothetical protein
MPKNIEVEPQEEVAVLKSRLAELAVEKDIQWNAEEMEQLYIDWASLVRPDGLVDIEGQEYIKLSELRRLARLRGYVCSRPKVIQVPEYEKHRQTTVEWEIVWRDGTIDGAAADASWRTCNAGFRNYTVAIASNRAEARCIRAALGIDTCSYEEVGPEDEDLSGKITDQQVTGITLLVKRKKIADEILFELAGQEIAAKINTNGKLDFTKLTNQEGITVMGKLNAFKEKKNAKK